MRYNRVKRNTNWLCWIVLKLIVVTKPKTTKIYWCLTAVRKNYCCRARFPLFEKISSKNENFVENRQKSATITATENFHGILAPFPSQILNMALKQKDIVVILKWPHTFFPNSKLGINEKWMTELNDSSKALQLISNISYEYFSSFSSTYKRNMMFSLGNQFFAFFKRAFGTLWKVQNRVIRIPKQFQNVLTLVPILQTLKSLFSCQNFSSHFDYNLKIRTNGASKNVSKRYTCNCKSQQMFFNPAIPSKSGAGLHKICSVYLNIQNLPPKYQSKLQNIYLTC